MEDRAVKTLESVLSKLDQVNRERCCILVFNETEKAWEQEPWRHMCVGELKNNPEWEEFKADWIENALKENGYL